MLSCLTPRYVSSSLQKLQLTTPVLRALQLCQAGGAEAHLQYAVVRDLTDTLQGPEIRTGFLKDGQPIKLTTGKEITITTDYEAKGHEDLIAMRYVAQMCMASEILFVLFVLLPLCLNGHGASGTALPLMEYHAARSRRPRYTVLHKVDAKAMSG